MRNPLTKEGHDRLAAELNTLKNDERPAIVKAIAEARAHGDLSENAEYHSAKEKQGYIEARIRLLESVLDSAEIFDPMRAAASGRCVFASYVHLRSLHGGEVSVYRIVSRYEAKPDEGMLSSSSPMGKAVLGKRVGDQVRVATPTGEVVYEVVDILYQAP